ncbi:SusC/RagA family TonB-linked outer membrane protein [Tenacibaculum sp.]|uniref:SusC/RagA family TonB-linked outer membrane protein n=1 Tax=Tenacibaculum sp. TaxID=1906242 RepID=UPI003D0A3F73
MKNTFVNKVRGLLICVLFIASTLVTYHVWGSPLPNKLSLKSIQQQIKGKVVDVNGVPITGVSIQIKNSNKGSVSDFDGSYTIVAQPTDVLVFSALGYETQQIIVGNQTTINISLKEDVTSLDTVTINAGYYSVKKKERTGNISRVVAKDIELQPIVNPFQALQGRMAGVEVTQFSSVPGAAGTIRIRGQNSLRPEGNFPLYIIDGVPIISTPLDASGGVLDISGGIDPLNTLNLSNIESIEVLKDADATSIYGSRGSNGVILITTKKGREGKSKVNLNIYSGAGSVSKKLSLLNTAQYIQMRNEAFTNSGEEPTQGTAPDLLQWSQNRYTDWQEELLGNTAYITDVQGAVSGGNANTTFLFGGAYHKEDMVFPGDFGYHKITGNLNLNHTSSNQKFRVAVTANYGIDQNKGFNEGLFIQNAITLAPNAPALYNEDGSLNWEQSTWTNPLGFLRKTQEMKTNNIVTNAVLSYNLFPGFNIKTSLGYTNLHSEEFTKNPKSSNDPAFETVNSSQKQLTDRQSWIIEPQLTYSLGFGKWKLDALIGTTFQKSNGNTLYLMGQGYADESLLENLAAAEQTDILLQEDTEYAYTAIFARLGFNWQQRYFVNLTGRRDGSSRFGSNKRFSNFGAVGAAWIFSKEPFIQKTLSFMSFGKLRGSYGTTGSDQIADYGFYDTYQPTNGIGGLYPTGLANDDYSWEVNKKLELAGEFGFFKDHLTLAASWYRNRSSNQLVGYALPATTGFASIQANLPATVENEGWEVEIFTRQFQTNDFDWNTSFNITFPKNTLVAFPDIEQSSYANTYRVGESLNSALLYHSLGVNPQTGLFEVEDINQDGRYDFNDRQVIKDLGRQYYGGLNNSIMYKNIGLNFFFEFVKQDGRNELVMFQALGLNPVNQSVAVLDRWRQKGDVTNLQQSSVSYTANSVYMQTTASDQAISDASFIRLKTLSISYNIPSIYTEKAGLMACKLFLHGQNLFTITGYKGLDPQSARSGSLTYLPPLRTITAGLQLTF